MSAVDYVYLPLLGIVLVCVLMLVLRWAHRPSVRPPRPGRAVAGQHGMLVPVTTVRDPGTADRMVRALGEVGIRATMTGPAHEQLLLVWPVDAAAARDRLILLSRERRE